MTPDVIIVLVILLSAVTLFITEALRVDLVALMVLLAVALTGLVEPRDALSGFSNPAVVTVWAVFVLSGGLTRTGVAGILGRHVLRLAGGSEVGLVIAIMVTAAVLSAFMNNVGVAALLLPVVMDICRRAHIAPSKLLMPLAYASLLGGLMTLIGTPPNILISDALRENGLEPFGLFDYAPVGIAVVVTGVLYMTFIGRRLLPDRDPANVASSHAGGDLEKLYDLSERLSMLVLPKNSRLTGRTLAASRLGSALGVNVLGILRRGRMSLAPESQTILEDEDRLLVSGRLDRFEELQGQTYLQLDEGYEMVAQLMIHELGFHQVAVRSDSPHIGKTLRQLDFRATYGLNALALWHDGSPIREGLADRVLAAEDVLLVQGDSVRLPALVSDLGSEVDAGEPEAALGLLDQLLIVNVPDGSPLLDRTLREARLGEAFGLQVLGLARDGKKDLNPYPDQRLQAGDILVILGRADDLAVVQGLQQLEIASVTESLSELESDQVALAEAVLSPRTNLVGKTVKEMRFRDRFGLSVLAVLREGRMVRSQLQNINLKASDALLLHGRRDKLRSLAKDGDFLVLSEDIQEPVDSRKAPLAIAIMGIVLLPVLFGWLPIFLSAILGATLMILTRCLTMDEAYRFIEWRAVFLIAGMLPLGLALEKSGAARVLTDGVVAAVGNSGDLGILAAMYLVTALGAQVMPTAAVAILMAPIALNTAAELGISPHALLMTIALSASASFMSPVAHPANILVMGPGGYRFKDYIKVGLPLTLLCLAVVLLVLPRVWPLH